jgi:hypothetical protein
MINLIKYILLSLIVFAITVPDVRAASDRLPQVMVGQSLMTTEDVYGRIDMTVYGNTSGNYAIYNTGANLLSYEHNPASLSEGVLKCYDSIPSDSISNLSLPCFIHKYTVANQTQAVRAMSGTTYVDGIAEYQIPAIYLYSRTIVGDAVMPDYNNFAFWGKSLAQSNNAGEIDADTGAAWALDGYQINNKSQSSWEADTDGEYAKFDEKIQTLVKSGTVISNSKLEPAGTTSTLFLQILGPDITIDDLSTTTARNAKYPEGRVWVINGNVAIPAGKTIIYRGIGTIIIKGNLVVGDGTKIVPNDEKVDKLGIIVLGS